MVSRDHCGRYKVSLIEMRSSAVLRCKRADFDLIIFLLIRSTCQSVELQVKFEKKIKISEKSGMTFLKAGRILDANFQFSQQKLLKS